MWIDYAIQNKLTPFISMQNHHSLIYREEERERLYRRRVERGPVEELPYGDERPTSSRRRRAEDEDDRRDSRDSKVIINILKKRE